MVVSAALLVVSSITTVCIIELIRSIIVLNKAGHTSTTIILSDQHAVDEWFSTHQVASSAFTKSILS
jgi:hypothetical protein